MVFRCFQWGHAAAIAIAAFTVMTSNHFGGTAQAQPPLASVSPESAPVDLPPRKLADGVMTIVPPAKDAADTVSGTFDLSLVENYPDLAWTPPNFPEGKPHFASPAETLLELSRNITFRHYVWYLEFSFKPVRLIEVEVLDSQGIPQRKVAWYMVYSVRYPGEDLQANADLESQIPATPNLAKVNSVRFMPRFSLVSKERNFILESQILPSAKRAIELRERVGKPLHDPIEMTQLELKQSDSPDDAVWGVAIWTDVDPRLDFFAVDVRGLTNAYKMREDESGDVQFERKTLRIYHWRPGDGIDEHKDRIRLGVPAFEDPERLKYHLDQFNLRERLDYQWIYR